jgi:hypothetical protein
LHKICTKQAFIYLAYEYLQAYPVLALLGFSLALFCKNMLANTANIMKNEAE